ncbi:hypothetical protein ACJ41O_006685 [Fusarium nematophilum]
MQSILSILLLLLTDPTAGYLVPNPPGKCNVTLTTGPTADYQGPFLEETLNISVNLTPFFLEARLPVCPDHPDSCSPLDDGPILVFSPSYSVPRFYYNALASAIANEDFTVITIFGSPPPPGLSQPVEIMSQPVLFMSHQDYFDPSWLAVWPQLKGPKLAVYVANTTHYTFSDAPTLLQAAGQSTAPLPDLLGTIAPAEMVRILTAYTIEWMNGAFTGKQGGPLLQGQSRASFQRSQP